MPKLDPLLIKVTAFITRDYGGVQQLLVFRHPNGSLQIPAGTANVGEAPEAAALREGGEESGLDDLRVGAALGVEAIEVERDQAYLLTDSLLLLTPDDSSTVVRGNILQRGFPLRVGESSGAFTRVNYEETELRDGERIVIARRKGWVPTGALTQQVERHSYHLLSDGNTPREWQVQAEPEHIFTCFWQPLAADMGLTPPQDAWLAAYYEALGGR
jgi:8-oxo-dGTP pyrophosphatase MutT (NUDIX family)